MPSRPITDYASAPFNGPFSMSAIMLDAAGSAPFEGVWVPVSFAKAGTFELLLGGTGPAATVQLWATNQPNPTNTYTLTIGGSETDADTLTLTFKPSALPAVAIAITTAGGESTSAIATAFAAGINANTVLQSLGVAAVALAAVVTITFPSIAPNQAISGPTQPGTPPAMNTIGLAATKSGGASETLTVTVGIDGTEISTLQPGLSAPPNVPFPVAFMKARMTAISGTNPTATLNFNGAA